MLDGLGRRFRHWLELLCGSNIEHLADYIEILNMCSCPGNVVSIPGLEGLEKIISGKATKGAMRGMQDSPW